MGSLIEMAGHDNPAALGDRILRRSRRGAAQQVMSKERNGFFPFVRLTVLPATV